MGYHYWRRRLAPRPAHGGRKTSSERHSSLIAEEVPPDRVFVMTPWDERLRRNDQVIAEQDRLVYPSTGCPGRTPNGSMIGSLRLLLPRLCELEPHWRMAQTAGRTSAGGLNGARPKGGYGAAVNNVCATHSPLPRRSSSQSRWPAVGWISKS